MEDETNVEDVVDETNEDLEANPEDDVLDTETGSIDEETAEVEDSETDDRDSARDRATNQINRLKDEIRRLKSEKSGQEGGQKTEGLASSDLLYRTYLGQQGYTNRDIQDKAIDRAKRLGLSVDQLIADPDEKAVLDAAVKRTATTNAQARPTGKGGTRTKDAKWYADNNVMPTDPKLIPEVWAILADRDR